MWFGVCDCCDGGWLVLVFDFVLWCWLFGWCCLVWWGYCGFLLRYELCSRVLLVGCCFFCIVVFWDWLCFDVFCCCVFFCGSCVWCCGLDCYCFDCCCFCGGSFWLMFMFWLVCCWLRSGCLIVVVLFWVELVVLLEILLWFCFWVVGYGFWRRLNDFILCCLCLDWWISGIVGWSLVVLLIVVLSECCRMFVVVLFVVVFLVWLMVGWMLCRVFWSFLKG